MSLSCHFSGGHDRSIAFLVDVFAPQEADIRFIRRMQRDIKERQRSVGDVVKQYMETVRPMHELFVSPSKVRCRTRELIGARMTGLKVGNIGHQLASDDIFYVFVIPRQSHRVCPRTGRLKCDSTRRWRVPLLETVMFIVRRLFLRSITRE